MARKNPPAPMIDTNTLVDGSAMVANFVPGPIGNIASIGIAPIQGSYQAEKEREELGQALDMDLKREKNSSPTIRKKLARMASYWQDRTMEAVVSLVGGGVGMMLAGMMFPVAGSMILGLIVGGGGAIAGGMLANKAYNTMFPATDQDAVVITTELYQKQKAGEAVAPEAVFAALAASLPGRSGKRLEKELEKMTGTRDFNVALSEGHVDVLHHLMKKYDTLISTHHPYLPDSPHNLDQTVAERYTQLINTRQMRASSLLKPQELQMLSMQLAQPAHSQGMDMSMVQSGMVPPSGLPPMKRSMASQLSAN